MPTRNPSPLPGRQCGAALVTGLLIMVIMTLVGIATMESSIIQTNLASNSQLNAIGFQTTETTLTLSGNDAGLINQALNAAFDNTLNNLPRNYPLPDITLDTGNRNSGSGGTVPLVATAQVTFCGAPLPSQSPGTGQSANQNALQTMPTEYVYTIMAQTNVGGGQANTRHILQTRIPAMTQNSPAGNVALCQI